jgi:hypothetical protein
MTPLDERIAALESERDAAARRADTAGMVAEYGLFAMPIYAVLAALGAPVLVLATATLVLAIVATVVERRAITARQAVSDALWNAYSERLCGANQPRSRERLED